MSRKYNKPFLNEVIVRVDLSEELTWLTESLPGPVRKKISDSFPIHETREVPDGGISFIFEEGKFRTEQNKIKEDIFYSLDRSQYLCLSTRYVYISYQKYSSFDNLKTKFLGLLDSLFRFAKGEKVLAFKRFGLRYINFIELTTGEPTDWKGFIHSNLLCSLKINDPTKISRAFHDLMFNYGDMQLHFQYGMHNPDFPDVIYKKLFVLDFDAYCSNIIDSISGLEKNLIFFHTEIEKLFEECITDKLRKIMGVVN